MVALWRRVCKIARQGKSSLRGNLWVMASEPSRGRTVGISSRLEGSLLIFAALIVAAHKLGRKIHLVKPAIALLVTTLAGYGQSGVHCAYVGAATYFEWYLAGSIRKYEPP